METKPVYADYRLHVTTLLEASLLAADPATAVRRCLAPSDFSGARGIFLVGAGKAGVSMAEAAASILGDRLTSGVIAVPHLPPGAPDRVRFIAGGHPTPDEGSLEAGSAIAGSWHIRPRMTWWWL